MDCELGKDILAEREALRSTSAARRFVVALPWPVRVILPFVFKLGLPIALLAVGFGIFASLVPDARPLRRPAPVNLIAHIEADPPLVSEPTIDLGRLEYPGAFKSFPILNTSGEDMAVRYIILGEVSHGIELRLVSLETGTDETTIPAGGNSLAYVSLAVLPQWRPADDIHVRIRIESVAK
jgi:hypothetical protein